MIKVIHKTLDMLELLARNAGTPVGLRDVAGPLKYHLATTANILRTLMDRQYVEQVAPRKGYLLGPAVFRLAGRGPYRQDLVTLTRPILEALAQAVDETVLLATLHGGQRFVLCQVDGHRSIRVGAEYLFQENVYATATGRLLLAHLDGDDLKAALARLGSPQKDWPEAAAPAGLAAELAAIRDRGWVCHKTPTGITGLAFPILAPSGRVAAALGLFLPAFRYTGRHRQDILKRMKAAAKELSKVWPQ